MWITYKDHSYWCNYVGIDNGIPQYVIEDWWMNPVTGPPRKKVKDRYKKALKREKEKEMSTIDFANKVPMPIQYNEIHVKAPIYKNPYLAHKCTAPKQEKENTMGYNEANLEIDQRNHLRRRLDNIRDKQFNTARETYHQDGLSLAGMTKDEVTATLTFGKGLKLNDGAFDGTGKVKSYFSAYDVVAFVDPLEDDAGFEKAEKAINKAYTTAKDTILVLPLADGLKALQDFEAMTF